MGLAVVTALPTISSADTTPQATAPGLVAAAPSSFADLAAKVSPAVVNVSSTHVMTQEQGNGQMPFDFPEGSPFEQFFKQFQQQQQREQQKHPQKVHSLGSGFVIDPSG